MVAEPVGSGRDVEGIADDEEVIRPSVLVLLGATAAQALLGAAFRVTRERGRPIVGTELAEHVVATLHPSAIVRIRDREEREEAVRGLASDLRTAADLIR